MTAETAGQERLYELLIKRALWGIDTGEAREMGALSAHHPDVDLDMIDRTVATLDVVELGPTPPMPGSIGERVMRELNRGGPPQDAPRAPASASAMPWIVAALFAVLALIGWTRSL